MGGKFRHTRSGGKHLETDAILRFAQGVSGRKEGLAVARHIARGCGLCEDRLGRALFVLDGIRRFNADLVAALREGREANEMGEGVH